MAIQFRPGGPRRGASPPSPTGGLAHLVGANVDYSGYPGMVAGTLQQDTATLDGRLATALGISGLVLAGPHGYSGTAWPSAFSSSAVSWAPGVGYAYSFLNVKTGNYTSWAGVVAGNWDSYCSSFVNSVPDGHTLVFTPNHEPENDKGGGYGGPIDDGGVWEGTYADQWSRGIARLANLVAVINRPNVFMAAVLMHDTLPSNGQLGTLGLKNRDPEKWNAWKYMTPAARARTIFAPDVYTNMTSSGGAFQTFASKYDRVGAYTTDAGWGVQKFGIFEHTINNDVLASDSAVGAVWRDDVRAYLRNMGDSLACYVAFSQSTGFASGNNGWVDSDQPGGVRTSRTLEFAAMARELNTGAGSGGGTAGIAYRAYASNTKNDAAPTLTIPATAQVDDTAYVQHVCTSSVTVGNLTQSGWTLIGAQQTSGNAKVTIWRKKLVLGDIGTAVTPTMSVTSRWAMQVVVYDGVHLTTPEDVTPVFSTDNTTVTTHTTAAITPVTTGAVVLQLAADRGTSTLGVTTWGQPAGYTLRGQQPAGGNPGGSLAVADKPWTSGAEGPVTWTSDAALPNWCGTAIALRPA